MITQFLEKELIFRRKNLLKRIYELKHEDNLIFQLEIKNPLTQKALVKGLGEENIEFYKNWLLSREINIRYEGYELPFATYKSSIFGLNGIVNLPLGLQLFLKYDLFGINYELKNDFGETLIKLKGNFFYQKANVKILSKSKIIDEHPWLIALVFYIMIKRRNS